MTETERQHQELAVAYSRPAFENADEKLSNRRALAEAWASLACCANAGKPQRPAAGEVPVNSLMPERVAEGMLAGLQASGAK